MRISLWIPAVVLCVRLGPVACVGLLLGMLTSRGIGWLIVSSAS